MRATRFGRELRRSFRCEWSWSGRAGKLRSVGYLSFTRRKGIPDSDTWSMASAERRGARTQRATPSRSERLDPFFPSVTAVAKHTARRSADPEGRRGAPLRRVLPDDSERSPREASGVFGQVPGGLWLVVEVSRGRTTDRGRSAFGECGYDGRSGGGVGQGRWLRISRQKSAVERLPIFSAWRTPSVRTARAWSRRPRRA